MPHKYNADRRHSALKTRYKVTNWQAYEAGLRQRGSLTIWFTEDAIAAWRAPPGGQARYSDLAVASFFWQAVKPISATTTSYII
jgi:hypothetical protein